MMTSVVRNFIDEWILDLVKITRSLVLQQLKVHEHHHFLQLVWNADTKVLREVQANLRKTISKHTLQPRNPSWSHPSAANVIWLQQYNRQCGGPLLTHASLLPVTTGSYMECGKSLNGPALSRSLHRISRYHSKSALCSLPPMVWCTRTGVQKRGRQDPHQGQLSWNITRPLQMFHDQMRAHN